MKKIIVLATLDTKYKEVEFLKERIFSEGGIPYLIDVGCTNVNSFQADLSNAEVAIRGDGDIRGVAKQTQFDAVKTMIKGACVIVSDMLGKGEISGIISIGGSVGTVIGTSVMKQLPIGFPKLMISTVASGDIRAYIEDKDITLVNSVVDIAGLNTLTKKILSNAASAIVGMSKNSMVLPMLKSDRRIGVSMFGVTTACVSQACQLLEHRNFEVFAFHCVSTGGKALEELTRSNYFAGVLDVTTTELADELCGGIFSAGEKRLEAAIDTGVPYVLSCGALDIVNFGHPDTIPLKYQNRKFHRHTETITLMRTNVSENIAIGKAIAEKLNRAKAPTAIFLPRRGLSSLDMKGKVFYGAEEDQALFDSIKQHVSHDLVEVIELDLHINSEAFAFAMVEKLCSFIKTLRGVAE